MSRSPEERDLESFFDSLLNLAIKPLNMPEDCRDVYFNLVQRNLFPKFRALRDQVHQKGRPTPFFGEPQGYAHGVSVGRGG